MPAPRLLLGTVRISVVPAPGAGPVFVGITPAGAASRYLAGVGYDTVRGITASLPALAWIAAGLLAGGVLVLAAGLALVAVPARRAASRRTQALAP